MKALRGLPLRLSCVKVGWVAYVLALLLWPFVFKSGFGVQLAAQACIAIVACLSLNLLLGQGGMLSFGHAVYTGLGAYAAIHALNAAASGRFHVPVSVIPLVGGLGGLLAAVVLGYPTTRRAGTTFAMITLGLCELVFALAAMMSGFFGGEGGIAGNRVIGPPVLGVTFGPPRELHVLLAVWCLASTGLLAAFVRTPLGLSLNAVRDNPERAAFLGLDTSGIRYRSFVIAGFFAGIAGGMAALTFEIVTPDSVSPIRSASYLLFTVMGGTSTFAGPIVGAVLMVLCSALLPSVAQAWLLYVGVAFMAVMVVEPRGVSALGARWWPSAVSVASRAWHRRLTMDDAVELGAGALRVTSFGIALLAAAAIIEMSYRLRLDAGLGTSLRFLGLDLDVASGGTWAALVIMGLVAAAVAYAAPRLVPGRNR